jgi:hypothetical protein
MSNTAAEKRSPSRGSKHICVPFASEAHYQECVADVAKYRTYLTTVGQQHPELFPRALAQGYTFHDRYHSRKQGVVLRRIKLKGTQERIKKLGITLPEQCPILGNLDTSDGR